MRETTIVTDIRAAIGEREDVLVFRNNTGALPDARGRLVRYGLAVGSADLVCILAPWGHLLALEVKAPGGRVRPEQAAWGAAVARVGASFAVVRSVDDALEALRSAQRRMACTYPREERMP